MQARPTPEVLREFFESTLRDSLLSVFADEVEKCRELAITFVLRMLTEEQGVCADPASFFAGITIVKSRTRETGVGSATTVTADFGPVASNWPKPGSISAARRSFVIAMPRDLSSHRQRDFTCHGVPEQFASGPIPRARSPRVSRSAVIPGNARST